MATIHTEKQRARAATNGRAAQVDALLDQWVSQLELAHRGERGAPTPQAGERAAVRDALRSIGVDGSTAKFADDRGGTITLARSGGRIVHEGTVGVRGPFRVSEGTLVELGLSEAQARALEFVLAWFGSAFDAVAAKRDREGAAPTLSWGVWPLTGGDVPRALAAWKQAAPEAFASLLGKYGIDVSQRDELRGPVLVVLDPARGVARGDRASEAIASDARRLAVLARAGRDEGARRAQIDRVVKACVLPLLRSQVRRGESRVPLAEVVTSPRGLAALLCVARVLDPAAIDEALRIALSDASSTASEDAAVEALVRYVRIAGHPAAAHDARRASSSPELAV